MNFDILIQIFTDPGFAIGYIGELINHLIFGPPM